MSLNNNFVSIIFGIRNNEVTPEYIGLGMNNIDAVEEIRKDMQNSFYMPNGGVDAEAEMMKLLGKEIYKSKEEKYTEIKEVLNIESFMKATDNNLNMLFKYMFSATKGIRLSNTQVAEFIKDEYGDDFFLRRELLRIEENQRGD